MFYQNSYIVTKAWSLGELFLELTTYLFLHVKNVAQTMTSSRKRSAAMIMSANWTFSTAAAARTWTAGW